MKVLLLKDVYKLGQAGDVKKVADGYARNYLIPRRLATLATKGALKQADWVRATASELREKENREKAGVAERLDGLRLNFPVRASEQGRLYGSVTHQMIADAIEAACGEKVDRRSVMSPPLRQIGEYPVPIRLTADLIPKVHIVVHHMDELPPAASTEAASTEGEPAEAEPAATGEPEPEAAGVVESPEPPDQAGITTEDAAEIAA